MLNEREVDYQYILDRHEADLVQTCLTWGQADGVSELAGLLGGDLLSAEARTL